MTTTPAPVPIPKFHEFIAPIGAVLRDASEPMTNGAINQSVARRMGLSETVLAVPHGSTDAPEAFYRMAWARTYLKKAGLITNPERGCWALTEQGCAEDAIDPEEVLRRCRSGLDADAYSPELPDYLVEELLERHRAVLAEGRPPAGEALEACYRRFREKFGPDVLARLEGPELLTLMHGRQGSRDSLAYWLEFKNDDEFPATFGSIAGGSALKFGLYQSAERGEWMSGSPQAQRRLTLEEAVAMATSQRDQLVAVARHLHELAKDPEVVDYDALQARVEELAPDLHDKGWAHKYFSLNAPSVLDDYHALEYQKYHLIKLGKIPAERRYLNARFYLGMARQLGIPVTHLGSVLNARDGEPRPTWRIELSDEQTWESMLTGRFAGLGGEELGPLTEVEVTQGGKRRVRELVEAHMNGDAKALRRTADGLFRFVTGVRQGDTIVAVIGSTVVGVGTCSGDYTFQAGTSPAHRRAVDWTEVEHFDLPKIKGVRTRFRQLRHPDNLVALQREMARPDARDVPPRLSKSAVGDEANLAVPLPPLAGFVGRIDEALRRKGQVILYGPPGTGKTYWADFAIGELAARSWFGLTASRLSDEQRAQLQQAGAVERCTFHPAYGYEDFLAGYRPVLRERTLVYEVQEGIFARLCRRAATQPKRSFYLLVDEINRGDIPRIFGELITSLEKDKRDVPLAVPLREEPFTVPSNVFLIGTMNTADRSVALLDAALRRRFAFIELMPDPSLLDEANVGGLPLGAWLAELNARIVRHVGRDARNLQVGHSYLMRSGEPLRSVDRFAAVLRDDIVPLLQEYCYEDFAALERILGATLIHAERQAINQDLFATTRRAALIDALLTEFADITATPDAARAEAPVDEQAENGDDETDDGDDA